MSEPAGLFEAADQRWRDILADRPDLGPAVDLQQRLLTIVVALGQDLEATWRPRLSPAHAASKLSRGVPAFREEAIALPAELVVPALLDFCRCLAESGARDAAGHIDDALRGRLQPATLLTASFTRDQRGVRLTAAELDLSADLLWLVGELGAGPVANALQRMFFEQPDPAMKPVHEALAAWDHGSCPACGSWPAFAAIVAGERLLVCAFCGARWQPRVYRCVYCGEDGQAFRTAAPDMDRLHRRLEICGGCGGYLKSTDLPAPPVFPFGAIEDLATTDLDVIAMEQGYGRPPMPENTR